MTKVLLIEDDTVLRENIAELLELSDFEVLTAPNGKLGLKSININIPDIIICDIMMPELDGYEVLNEVTKNNKTKHIPFIFLSAKTEHQDVRKGMNLGADDYITKPFTEDELVSAIKSRLAKDRLGLVLFSRSIFTGWGVGCARVFQGVTGHPSLCEHVLFV